MSDIYLHFVERDLTLSYVQYMSDDYLHFVEGDLTVQYMSDIYLHL